MVRAAAWTVGLFGAGAALARAFTTAWLEPIVLLALGVAFLFVSRSSVRRSRTLRARRPADVAPPAAAALATERASSAATAPLAVEQQM